MPFRQKLKATFSSKKSGSSGSTSSSTTPPRRTDIEYYKPHEIPKSKYRGRVDKEHQDKLDAYSFADAFTTVRRKTSQALSGTFSPGGTHAQSRRASWMSRPKSSVSRATSVGSDSDGKSLRRKSVAATGAPNESPVQENEDDDTDVANAGISRTATATDRPPNAINIPTLRLEKTVTGGDHVFSTPTQDTPFTTEELEKAMTRATLRPRRETVTALPEAIMA